MRRIILAALLATMAAMMAVQSRMSATAEADPTIVRTAQGTLKGVATADGLIRFIGVPYAAPPIGTLRWKDPVAPAPYAGVYQATTPRSICVQSHFSGPGPDATKSPAGDEDCLYMNIFSPALKARRPERVPVLVWIHGGGNTSGSGMQFDGAPLAAEHHVVTVTFNYRLGTLGFFAHPALSGEQSPKRSGNYGLLDQQAALTWVQTNIAAFGGDPANVTIFGESAGGLDVFQQLISPTAAGLFHKAVSQSGAYTRAPRTLEAQEQSGVAVATAWGCAQSQASDVAACLRAVPAATLVGPTPGAGSASAPIVDGKVLVENQATAFKTGRFHRVPVIAGFTRDEGTSLAGPRLGAAVPTAAAYDDQAQKLFGIDASKIAAQYPPAKYRTAAQALAEAYGDHRMACGALQDGENIAKFIPSTYVYEFADDPPADPRTFVLNYPPRHPRIDVGVTHAMDVTYWLNLFQPTARESQKSLGKTMRAYLVNFARTGNPNGPGLPAWSPYAATNRTVMRFAIPIEPAADAYSPHHCAFWYEQPASPGL